MTQSLDEVFASMRADAERLATSQIVQVAKFGADVNAMLAALEASIVALDA